MTQHRTNDITLVNAKVVKNNKVQLEFVQHCTNEHKKTGSDFNELLAGSNLGDAKFGETGGNGNYHFWLTGTREGFATSWSLDLAGLAKKKGSELKLNITNPQFTNSVGIAKDVSIIIKELTEDELGSAFSAKQLDKLREDFVAGNADWKRRGKGGSLILSNSKKIYSHSSMTLTAEPEHRFLPMDSEVQAFTAPAAVVQEAAPEVVGAESGDLPF